MIESDGWETVYRSEPIVDRHGEIRFSAWHGYNVDTGAVCAAGIERCSVGCIMFDYRNKGDQ